MICDKCKNIISMSAFTKTNCNKCGIEITTGHIPGYTICKSCSEELELCEQCGEELKEKYFVDIPFTGYCRVEVTTKNKEQALKEGWEKVNFDDHCIELEFHKKVVEDHVFYGLLNKIHAEKEEK